MLEIWALQFRNWKSQSNARKEPVSSKLNLQSVLNYLLKLLLYLYYINTILYVCKVTALRSDTIFFSFGGLYVSMQSQQVLWSNPDSFKFPKPLPHFPLFSSLLGNAYIKNEDYENVLGFLCYFFGSWESSKINWAIVFPESFIFPTHNIPKFKSPSAISFISQSHFHLLEWSWTNNRAIRLSLQCFPGTLGEPSK